MISFDTLRQKDKTKQKPKRKSILKKKNVREHPKKPQIHNPTERMMGNTEKISNQSKQEDQEWSRQVSD